jgi:hypothetical protein
VAYIDIVCLNQENIVAMDAIHAIMCHRNVRKDLESSEVKYLISETVNILRTALQGQFDGKQISEKGIQSSDACKYICISRSW